jgi:hypothetical protein
MTCTTTPPLPATFRQLSSRTHCKFGLKFKCERNIIISLLYLLAKDYLKSIHYILGCDAAQTDGILPTFQRIALPPCSGTNCKSSNQRAGTTRRHTLHTYRRENLESCSLFYRNRHDACRWRTAHHSLATWTDQAYWLLHLIKFRSIRWTWKSDIFGTAALQVSCPTAAQSV